MRLLLYELGSGKESALREIARTIRYANKVSRPSYPVGSRSVRGYD